MSFSRRRFLKDSFHSITLLSCTTALPTLWTPAGYPEARSRSTSERVLVVVQLSGGNDGLNTIVPYADDDYGRVRNTLRLTSKEVRKIDDYLGFHPEMDSMWRLYQEGLIAIIQGVGYPDSPRSHPIAMQNWHTSLPAEVNPQRGWLGRVIDSSRSHPDARNQGAFIGEIECPFILNAGEVIVPSLHSSNQLVLNANESERASRQTISDLARIARSSENPLVDVVRNETVEACEVSRRIVNTIGNNSDSAEYPQFPLAQKLRTIARLIKAEAGFSIYVTELGGPPPGGFDTHANQRGNHAALLRQLSESVSAFSRDLQRDQLFDRVALVTFSEFGRTLAENGRGGTGHGAAAPIFLLSGCAEGGLVGAHPSLSDLNEGALAFQVDYRSLHATLLDDWLGLDSKSILGQEFDQLSLFENA